MKLIPLLVLGIVVLNSCEGDLDNLGSQLVDANGSEGFDKAFSLIAYNINNNDLIRSDASKLDSVRIGAFTEDVFGGQKASYITQIRLNTYNPDFGTNPAIDSVVLTLKPKYETSSDSLTTTTNEDYIYPDGNVAAKKVVNTYPVSKYGRWKINGVKAPLTIKVNEVNDFLGGVTDSLFSNKAVALGAEIGSKAFDGTVNSVKITKDSDNSDIVPEIAASLRINLDKDFFKNKIISKQGDQVLKDAASFIRYFKGISISVVENDGYLFSMAPNDAGITIYYKNDVTATDGTVTRTQAETTLNLGSSNVHFSKVTYDRPSTYPQISSTPNDTNGDALIYAQGMGGASFGIKIPEGTVTTLRDMYKNNKIGIVSAKIRLYNDSGSWKNSFKKPNSLLVREKGAVKDSVRFLPDMTALASTPNYSLIKTVNLTSDDAYYDIVITKSIKDIVEGDSPIRGFRIDVGNYLVNNSTGLLIGQNYNDRAYSPYRIVLKGTDQNNTGGEIISTNKAVQLRLIYTKK